MLEDFSLSFSNFRSFEAKVGLPLKSKFTILTGQNNSGKTNVLRFLSYLLNDKLDRITSFDRFNASAPVLFCISMSKSLIKSKILKFSNALAIIDRTSDDALFRIDYSIGNNASIVIDSTDDLFNTTFDNYLNTNLFIQDHGHSSANNKIDFLSLINPMNSFSGTTYVPNIRFITTPNQNPPIFDSDQLAGETIAFDKVVERLAEMDRPPVDRRSLRNNLKNIEEFIAYCMEKKKVSIQVPIDKSTILIDIDGNEKPIGLLGTGVHQLIMIGLASMGFANKTVLIDEPELHLHPRAQRRIISFLDEHTDSNFIISTHSATVLDSIDADIIQITHDGRRSQAVTIAGSIDRYRAIRDLGFSPSELVLARFAIWVEGPSDRIYLNSWIQWKDSSLIEGADYSFVFYGGKNLANHKFTEMPEDLLQALAFCRETAVIMDRDRSSVDEPINETKLRIQREVAEVGGLVWITAGREIENYIPSSRINQIQDKYPEVKVRRSEFVSIVPKGTSKVDLARYTVGETWNDWPLDLSERVQALVDKIRAAK